jgi:hypothetical protein
MSVVSNPIWEFDGRPTGQEIICLSIKPISKWFSPNHTFKPLILYSGPNLKLFSFLHLGLLSGFFPKGFPTENFYAFMSTVCAISLTEFIFLWFDDPYIFVTSYLVHSVSKFESRVHISIFVSHSLHKHFVFWRKFFGAFYSFLLQKF